MRISPVNRILNAQNKILEHHLPSNLFKKMETPQRHRGMNSVRFPGTELAKPPLIIAHGFGSGLGFFFACLPALIDSGRTVYLVDWLGFGGSERPSVGCSPSRRELTSDFFTLPLLGWMEAEGIEKSTLVAHSLGGLLACRFAEKFANKVEKLVLASPAGLSAEPIGALGTITRRTQFLNFLWSSGLLSPQKIVRILGNSRGRSLVHRAVEGRFSHQKQTNWNKALVADYLFEISNAKASGGDYALGALLQPPFHHRAIVAKEPVPHNLGFQQFPIHTIFGDHDWLHTPSAVEKARKLGKVSVMGNAGHHLYLDQPEIFASLCLN